MWEIRELLRHAGGVNDLPADAALHEGGGRGGVIAFFLFHLVRSVTDVARSTVGQDRLKDDNRTVTALCEP